MRRLQSWLVQLKMNMIDNNEDLYKIALDYYMNYCIANINKEYTRVKCVATPKDGKVKRRKRRKQQLKRRKGRL